MARDFGGVEPCLVKQNTGLWVGVSSQHSLPAVEVPSNAQQGVVLNYVTTEPSVILAQG
jgi:hypothetical protein